MLLQIKEKKFIDKFKTKLNKQESYTLTNRHKHIYIYIYIHKKLLVKNDYLYISNHTTTHTNIISGHTFTHTQRKNNC